MQEKNGTEKLRQNFRLGRDFRDQLTQRCSNWKEPWKFFTVLGGEQAGASKFSVLNLPKLTAFKSTYRNVLIALVRMSGFCY